MSNMTFYSVIVISVGPEYCIETELTYNFHLRTVGLVAACLVCACPVKVNFTTISLNPHQIDVRLILQSKANIEQGTLDFCFWDKD